MFCAAQCSKAVVSLKQWFSMGPTAPPTSFINEYSFLCDKSISITTIIILTLNQYYLALTLYHFLPSLEATALKIHAAGLCVSRQISNFHFKFK